MAHAFERRLALTYQQAIRARANAEDMHDLARSSAREIEKLRTSLDESPEMTRLASRLGLDAAQVELVWALTACSVDGRLLPHLETLGGGHARRGLSMAVYAMLADLGDETVARLAHWLAAANPLVAVGLLVPAEQVSPAARAYVASSRLVELLRGDDRGQDRNIAPLHVRTPATGLLHDEEQLATVRAIRAALGRSRRAILVVEGPVGSGRSTGCAMAADAPLLVLDLATIGPADLSDALVALQREELLRPGMIPLLANVDQLLGEGQHEQRRHVAQFIDHVGGPVLVTSTVAGIDLGTRRAMVRIPWEVPSIPIRAQLWQRAVAQIGARVEDDLGTLAHRYQVGPAAIERAVASVQLLHPAGNALRQQDLIDGLRHNIAERLAGLAQRVEVTQSWDDLVIAEDIRDSISTLVSRVRHSQQVLETWGFRRKIARGTGVAGLFSGPPGTGKTMVAGLIARELALELYQVDLSKVVSKWVGETEKNLGRVFDAAEEGHGLLLFDEADALFGQRTNDMKGANDRYANLEVNYLLQRVEAFGGITILTTNLETAIDTALKRRLAAHIVFAAPEEDERAALWERQTTTGDAPLDDDVDHQELAMMFPKMTGANIRNAAIAAAFLAAAGGDKKITQAHLIRAGRAEYRSMGHVIADVARSL